jgi:hypothetical protein
MSSGIDKGFLNITDRHGQVPVLDGLLEGFAEVLVEDGAADNDPFRTGVLQAVFGILCAFFSTSGKQDEALGSHLDGQLREGLNLVATPGKDRSG